MLLRPEFKYQTLIYDIETDGLLPTLTKIHCLVIREFETGQVWRFRKNSKRDNIREGLDMLEDAACLVGHNSFAFDEKAILKVYPDFAPRGKMRDTLPLVRMIFANQKDKDFRLRERGKLPGYLIGKHGLEAWGWRLGLHKGDYAKEMQEKGLDPWAYWNNDMEDYCENDVDITTLLWSRILKENYPESSILFQLQAHSLMTDQQENGVYFRKEDAEKLADEIEKESIELGNKAIEHFGTWLAPAKKRIIKPLWEDAEGINAAKTYDKPRNEYGEDYSRAIWGDVVIPKKTMRFKNKEKGDKFEGRPYCPIKIKEFKPTSRNMIIDRFTTVYDWKPFPEDFTEKGSPEISDEILRGLVGRIPMAEELAEVFYLNKRLGQIKTGKEAWLNHVTPEGKVHTTTNVGATLSGRAAHSSFNIAQVPKVKSMKVWENKEKGIFNPKVLDKDGKPISLCFNPDGTLKKSFPLKGRKGKHGWDCRRLFYVPEEWGTMVGCDLSGIEFRCLAELANFVGDNGVLIDIVLNGDIHEINRIAAGLDDREKAKTLIYALMYGGGDWKLGFICNPLGNEEQCVALGKQVREKLMVNVPSLGAAVKYIQKNAKKGFLPGLDGRRLLVRAKHSALNLKLQSDGALIAQKWALLIEDYLIDEGLEHGWDKDFVFLMWIHDEIQIAVRNEYIDLAKMIMVKAAADSGKFFNWVCPVDAEAKHGPDWSFTH